jgi:hypothetical protein
MAEQYKFPDELDDEKASKDNVSVEDDGDVEVEVIDDTPVQDRWYLEDRLQTIIDECKLNIKLKTTEEE